MPFTYEYPRPMVSVDVVALAPAAGGKKVLLVQRGHDPFKGLWALPGGFLDLDEDLEVSAARELLEETGIEAPRLVQIAAFGGLGRDPRGRTITVAFLAELDAVLPPAAGDDADAARWFPVDRLPKLAFDHGEIIATALAMAEAG